MRPNSFRGWFAFGNAWIVNVDWRKRPIGSRRASGDRYARIGRRARGLHFKTAVEWLEPRCMLSAQGITENAYTTVVLANPFGAGAAATGSSSPPSAAYTPTEILNAYGFNQMTFSDGTVQGNGAGQTIALIDAYDDPDITADLATFDKAFNCRRADLRGGPDGHECVAQELRRRNQHRLVARNLARRRMGPRLGPGRQYLARRSQ